MKKKVLRILSVILATALLLAVIFFSNAFVGNPISKALALNNAKEYVSKNYSDESFNQFEASYDFKLGCFVINVKSDIGADRIFTITYGFFGELINDNHFMITDKVNTANRINNEYKAKTEHLINAVLKEYDGFGFGEILCGDYNDEHIFAKFIPLSDLEIDKQYNINDLAEKAGHLQIHVNIIKPTNEVISDILLKTKGIFDTAGTEFNTVSITVTDSNYDSISVIDFPKEDIYEDGLTERVAEAILIAQQHIEKQNILKEEEIRTAIK